MRDVVRLTGATGLGSLLFFGAVIALPVSLSVPRSIILIEWVLTTYFTAAMWISYRLAFEVLQRWHQEVVSAPSTPHSCEFTGQEAAA